MKKPVLSALLLVSAFSVACGRGIKVVDVSPQCLQTGPLSFGIVEPSFPDEPFIRMDEGQRINRYTIEGRARNSAGKFFQMSVDTEAEECSVSGFGAEEAVVNRYPLKLKAGR